jgi:hypothetical protein
MGIRRLIDQWNTKTVGGASKLSVSNYDLVSNPVHVQDSNIDALELINTVGQATSTQSQSGPIPGTGKIVVHEQTTNDVQTVFRPDIDEVWAVLGADASAYGTGQNAATLFLSDGSADMVIADSSSAGDMNDHGFRTGVYIDYNLYLSFQPNNISSGTAVLEIALIRVR